MSDPAVIEGIRRKFEALNPVLDERSRTKELVEDFNNGGTEGRLKGDPEAVRAHDFKDKQLGKAIPYGVSDMLNNQGWVTGLKVSDHELATLQLTKHKTHGAWNYTISPRK